MVKWVIIFILGILLFFASVNFISAVISCGSQTYPDGTGYCCDQGNGGNGIFFSGGDYTACPNADYYYVKNDFGICNDFGPGNYTQPFCTLTRGATAINSGNPGVC